MLKHILEDPVLKIYIEGVDFLKEMLTIFLKYFPNKDETMKIVNPLILVIIDILGDQKQKIREKSIDFLIYLMKDSLEHVSNTIMGKFEQSKGNMSANQFGSILKVITIGASSFKSTTNNPKSLSSYMQLLNASLKHHLPSIRKLGEDLYVALYQLHGDSINQ